MAWTLASSLRRVELFLPSIRGGTGPDYERVSLSELALELVQGNFRLVRGTLVFGDGVVVLNHILNQSRRPIVFQLFLKGERLTLGFVGILLNANLLGDERLKFEILSACPDDS